MENSKRKLNVRLWIKLSVDVNGAFIINTDTLMGCNLIKEELSLFMGIDSGVMHKI